MLKSKHLSVNCSQPIRFKARIQYWEWAPVQILCKLITYFEPNLNNPLQIQFAKPVAIKPRLNSPRKLGAVIGKYLSRLFRKFPVNLQALLSECLNAILKTETRPKFKSPPLRFALSDTPFCKGISA